MRESPEAKVMMNWGKEGEGKTLKARGIDEKDTEPVAEKIVSAETWGISRQDRRDTMTKKSRIGG